MTCKGEGCDKYGKTLGLCPKHYTRLRAHGSPETVKLRVTRHGLRYHPLYHTWLDMRDRCNNSKKASYRYYGGRGIKVDPRWDNFANFLTDMGERPPGHSLDRIDNDGDYTPGNCRWATASEQMRNQSIRNNNKTGVPGVSYHKATGKYAAQLYGRYLGLYPTIELAGARVNKERSRLKERPEEMAA